MKLARMICIFSFFVLLLAAVPLSAQDLPKDYQEVLAFLGRTGDFKAKVLKLNIPRNHLHVTIPGQSTPTPFRFGAWVALTKPHRPTAPLMTHPLPAAAAGSPTDFRFDTAALNKIVGFEGEKSGSVYKFTVGRDDLHLTEMGATVNARMGLNSWAALAGNDGDAQVAGDIAMRESEVNAVLKALRSHGLNIVAIHHHMLDTQPNVIFLHYWGRGPAPKLAAGFRSALDVLGK